MIKFFGIVSFFVGISCFAAVSPYDQEVFTASASVAPVKGEPSIYEIQLRLQPTKDWRVILDFEPADDRQAPVVEIVPAGTIEFLSGWTGDLRLSEGPWRPPGALDQATTLARRFRVRGDGKHSLTCAFVFQAYDKDMQYFRPPMPMVNLNLDAMRPRRLEVRLDLDSGSAGKWRSLDYVPLTEADMDWWDILLTNYDVLAHPKNLPPRPEPGMFWAALDGQIRRAKILAKRFFDRYPDDPRRWRAADIYQDGHVFFYERYPVWDRSALDSAYESELALVRDEVAVEKYRVTAKLLDRAVLESKVSTLDQKARAAFRELQRGFSAMNAKYDGSISPEAPGWNALFRDVEDYVLTYRNLNQSGAERLGKFLKWTLKMDSSGEHAQMLVQRLKHIELSWVRSTLAQFELEADSIDKKLASVKFTAMDGRQIDLPAMKGKVVLLDFWATWCKPCVAAMPGLKALLEKHQQDGFEVIGFSGDRVSQEEVQKFLSSHDYTWPQHYDGKFTGNQFARLFNVIGWPTTYLIGRDGKVIGKNLHDAELEDAIVTALGSRN